MNINSKLIKKLVKSGFIPRAHPLRRLTGEGENYLFTIGWLRSVAQQESVDFEGNPIPWISYPCIKFLEGKLKLQAYNIFEYGCGNSTLWWSKFAQSIISIENDEAWYAKVSSTLPPFAKIKLISTENSFEMYVNSLNLEKVELDIIFIDGRSRSKCLEIAAKKITQTGIIILDNSERSEYQASIRLLTDADFKRLDFWGMAPIVNYESCTTIFYRSNNILSI